MKTFTKVALITAGITLSAGIALTTIGMIANHGKPMSVYFEDGLKVSDEVKCVEKPKTKVDSFKDILIDVSAADIHLIENDEDAFAVEYKFEADNEICEVKDDKLTIKSQKTFFFTFFNFHISKEDFYVNVYYPKGTEFNLVDLDTSAGDIEIVDDFTCSKLILDLSAGDVDLKHVKGGLDVDMSAGNFKAEKCEFGKSIFDLSAGDVDLYYCTVGGGEVDMSAGDFTAKDMILTASMNMDLSAGSVNIGFLEGQKIGYDFDLSAGSAKINGEKRGDEYTDKEGCDIVLTVDLSAGSVDITNR